MTSQPLRVLVAYSMASTYTTTTWDYLAALQRFTGFEVSYLHVTHDALIDFDLSAYDVVFQNYCSRLCFEGYVSASYQEALKRFKGLKILSVQDDYDRTSVLHKAIRNLGFDVLLTCIQSDFWPLVYPERELPGVRIIQGLTGYAPEDVAQGLPTPLPLRERKTVIGYRGRDIGAKYGRLGFDKYEIGRRMREICESRGIRHDIAMDDNSRIYGTAWFDFIASAQVMLGSESASNVFDFDGSIERRYNQMSKERGGPVPYVEFRPYIDDIEKNYNVGQISPRIFEYAAMRTPMVLFEGRYSDAMRPDEHYIALKKDFANIDTVLERIKDIDALQAMADRAHDHLIKSGKFGYRAFGRMLEATILQELYARRKSLCDIPSLQLAKRSVHQAGVGQLERAIKRISFGEWPTARPGTFDDFKARVSEHSLVHKVRRLRGVKPSKLALSPDSSTETLETCYRNVVDGLRPALARRLFVNPDTEAVALHSELEAQAIAINKRFFELAEKIEPNKDRLPSSDVAIDGTSARKSALAAYIVEHAKRHAAFMNLFTRTVEELRGPTGLLWRWLARQKNRLSKTHKSEIAAVKDTVRKIPVISTLAKATMRFVGERL